MYQTDTIAAISTPPGTGGLGVIRISGIDAFDVADKLFRAPVKVQDISSHTVTYGKIVDPYNGETIDEVLLLKLNGPRTFTSENTVEIDCHGGIVVLRRILELVISSGARLAEPGEFTRRAFLNGRIDLSQAEAVIDLINAKTEESSKAAINQLEGRLSGKLRTVRKSLIAMMAHMEVAFDYPEHDIEEITSSMVRQEAASIREELIRISEGFNTGRILREGINIVITGKPNVGKSSLLNVLSGSNRAIVTDIPGTTRDIIEEYVSIKGIPARITDTAGIRETSDIVERIGVEKAEKAVDTADLIIVMLDASTAIEQSDISIIEKAAGRKSIYIINKADIAKSQIIEKYISLLDGRKTLTVSLKDDSSREVIENTIYHLFISGYAQANDELLLTNIRHKNLVDKAAEDIESVLKAIDQGYSLDLAAIDLKSAAENLGMITGESASEDVLQEIFSRFCIGK